MRFFDKTFKAYFLNRPNRFLVRCESEGKILSAFLPNPGRLQELLLPGSVVHLAEEDHPGERKTRYTALAVERDGRPIMLHTHLTNEVARYLLENRKIQGLETARIIKPEVKAGRSRFDFLLRDGRQDILLEVKSCTLVGRRVAMFPDAITERGARHLRELARLSEEGIRAVVLFIVHWPEARVFMPDYHTDLNFARTLLQVRHRVEIVAVSVRWNQDLALSPAVRTLQIPWNDVEKEAMDRGGYLFILNLGRDRSILIGKLGRIHFKKGYYVYVGSAMANLSKRMERHRHLRKRHHWHIDDLREEAEFCSILAVRSSDRLECEMAQEMSKIAGWDIPKFGASDCACGTHLFGMTDDPLQSKGFHRLLQYFRMDRYEGME